MNDSLFREEVLTARNNRGMGGISLSQPLRLWLLAGVAAAAAALILGFLLFGEYTRRSKVVGQLVPDLGLSAVVAPTAGVVSRILPEEGERIETGASLALISVPRVTAAGADALSAIRAGLAVQLENVAELGESQLLQIDEQRTGTQRQLDTAMRELAQIEIEIATRIEQVRIAEETTERYRKAVADQLISVVQLGQQEQSLLEVVNARQALERQAMSLRRSIGQIEQQLRELPAQQRALQASTRRDLAMLEQERITQEANGELMLTAPVTGLVANRLIEPGQSVQPGQTLLTLLPQGSQLQAQLLVPSRAVGFVAPGDRVLLRYQAFPYQKFGHHVGRVIRVSRSATMPERGAPAEAEPYYRVLVALERQTITAFGKPEPLRPGMVLEADILGERRKLYEWLLEPLYSVTGRTGD